MGRSDPSGRAPVSVVVPCYNSAGTIARALASVAAQTWLPEEVIVVDDGSCDEGATTQALGEATGTYGCDWLRVIYLAENRGPGAARNVGWAVARQPYVAFLDSDDAWHPKKLAIQMGYMLRSPEVTFSAHRRRLWHGSHHDDPNLECCPHRALRARGLLLRNLVSTSTVVIKRDVSRRFPERRFSEDYELWLGLLLAGHRGVFLDQALAYCYKAPFGSGGLSSRLWAMERGELTTYWRLFRGRQLRVYHLAVCVPWSLTKFVRRALLSALRRAGQ